MKKITLFIASLFVAMAMFAEIKVDTLWTNTSAPINEMKSGIGYLNGELLVPSIESPNGYIYVYDAATGQPKTNADQSRVFFDSIVGFRFDDLKVNDIDVVNGHVYAFNGGVNTHTRLYHWSSKDAEPVRYGIDGDISTLTTGFDIKVDENGNGFFFAVRRDGKKQTYATVENYEVKGFTNLTVDLTALGLGAGSGNAVDIVNDSTIWIDNANTTPILFRFNKAKGEFTKLATLTSDLFGTTTGAGIEQFSVKGYNYLAVATCNHGTYAGVPKNSIVVYQLNDDYTITPVTGYLPAKDLYGYASTNGTNVVEPTVVIENDVVTIYHVGANGGMAAHKLSGFPENSGVIEVTTMAELKANEGKRVLYKGLEPAKVTIGEGWLARTDYFMPDSTTAFNYSGYVIPAKMDVYGTYNSAYVADEWSEATPTFVVDSVVAISAFNNMGDLINFVNNEATEAQKAASYEVKEPVVVTLASMFSFYVQYEAQAMWGGSSWEGLMVQVGRMSMFQTKAGDALQLKGAYVPATYDENDVMQQPAYFALETGTVVSENNKLNYASINLSETGLKYASEYYASFGRLSKGGKIIEHNYAYYYVVSYVDYVQNGNMYDEVSVTDSLQLMVAGPVDLDSYIGKELDKFIVGVLDYDAYSAAPIFYVTELQESKLYYDNIAELLAAGAQTDYSMSSVLRNPVLLTYISYNQWAGYTIFVQDETGAIALKGLGVAKEDGDGYDFPYTVVAGDSIKGVEGFTTFGEVAAFMWSGDEYVSGLKLEKVSDGVVTPIDITLAEFNADVALVQDAMMMGDFYLSKYANKVVRVKDLAREDDPEDEKWPYLVQGEEKIKVSTYYWGDIAVPYSIKSLTGIADYTVINGQTASIQPLNAASVEVAGGVNVELVTLTDIYTENGLIVVDGEFQIFTTTGQNVTDMNGNLQSGVYVVRTATAVGKVVVK